MPEKRFIIAGLTGSIGSGKTLAAGYFKELGAVIIDADLLAREAVKPGTDALERIKQIFGPSVLFPNGTLNRKVMGEMVFNNPAQRKALEEIVHPRVRSLFKQTLQRVMAAPHDGSVLVIYVVPLLFESNEEYPELEKIIVISAPRELCIKRIMERDGTNLQLSQAKYSSQLPIEQKEALADYVIVNDGDMDSLKESVNTLYGRIMSGGSPTHTG